MHYQVEGAAVQGRNIRFAWLLTMGECWHNNHHAYPGSARLGLFAGEWDPGWWVLLVLRRCGLVWGLRLPSDLAARPELMALDAWPQMAGGFTSGTEVTNVMAWPAAIAPARLLRSLIPNNIELRELPGLQRLSLTMNGHRLYGLPAICAAVQSQGGYMGAVAAFVLPLARTYESMRVGLNMDA